VVIGVTSFEIHLPDSRSLKDKRQVLRRVKDRLRAHHNVAVLEDAEHADLWQRAEVVVVSIATNRDALRRLFEAVRREVESHVPGHVLEAEAEFIEAEGTEGSGR
jgi:uncharacterized protein YlxP (DUF503 family)